MTQGVGSEKAKIAFATVPYPPDVPLLESRTTSSMELIVYIDRYFQLFAFFVREKRGFSYFKRLLV